MPHQDSGDLVGTNRGVLQWLFTVHATGGEGALLPPPAHLELRGFRAPLSIVPFPELLTNGPSIHVEYPDLDVVPRDGPGI